MRARRWFAALSALALVGGLSLVHGTSRAYAAGPGNDNFANAASISGTTGSTTVSNVGATTEVGEPSPSSSPADRWGATLWFSWTAPASGTYLFDTCDSHIDARINIYTGGAVNGLTAATSGDVLQCTNDGGYFWSDQREVNATGGDTYSIQVGGSGKEQGAITLRWWSQSTPLNDTAESAITLSADTGHTSGTNRFATQESDPSYVSNGVWWSWSPPSNGTYRFDTCGSNFDTKLGVYTLSGGIWNKVAENDDVCFVGSLVGFAASTGTTYYIEVGGFSSTDVGDIVLNWQPDAPPGNDNFSNATALPSTSSGSVVGDNFSATSETDEPDLSSGNTVWWTWEAPATGTVTFDTCGTDFQTDLIAYTGTDLADLTLIQDDTGSCLNASRIVFDATAGTVYRIRVDGDRDGPGHISLHWNMGTPPSNDDFSNASSISGSTGMANGNDMFATAQTGEPMTSNSWGGILGGHSVWWTWTAPDNTPVNFNTCGSAALHNAVIVYTGSSPDALTEVSAGAINACGDQGQAAFTPTEGTTYHIAVDPTDNTMGDLALRWSAVPDAPPRPSANVDSGSVDLSWSAPAVDNGARITGYILEYKSSEDSHWGWLDLVGTGTTTSFAWASPGLTWDFRVAADTDSGVGLFSPSTSLLVPGAPAMPDVPTATPGNGEVTLSWSAPSDNGSAITHYMVQYQVWGTEDFTTVGPFSASTRSTTIGSLTNGTNYIFEVAAENEYGLGAYSYGAQAMPVGPPPAPTAPVPGTPTFSKGVLTVPMSWTDNGDGGSAITDHMVRVYKYKAATKRSAASYTFFATIDTKSTDQSFTVTGLKSGAYAFTVAAVNGINNTGTYSGYSTPVSR